ncbi:MAG: hypothetical protein MJZ67_06710 [Bacteroidales bacterium]|nr:hypothetical protein [Bacteroidales bacterium]
MKKKSLFLIGTLLFSVLSSFLFTSCDKDTWCYLDVTVLDSQNNNAPAGGAWVKVQYVKANEADPNNPITGTIFDIGQCGADGVYRTKFAAPAIMTIEARIDEPDELNGRPWYRAGEQSIRLKSGETVTATVKVIGEKVLGHANFEEL